MTFFSSTGSAFKISLILFLVWNVAFGFAKKPKLRNTDPKAQAAKYTNARDLQEAEIGITLKLVDASNWDDLFEITDGSILNLLSVPNKLSIRADVDPSLEVIVGFVYDGVWLRNETIAPYMIAGERASNGLPKPFTGINELGTHNLEVVAYDTSTGGFIPGVSVELTVIQEAPQPNLILVNSKTGTDIGTFPSVIDLNEVGSALNLRVDFVGTNNSTDVSSVQFQINDGPTKTESSPPFVLAGQKANGDYKKSSDLTIPGTHMLQITAFSAFGQVVLTHEQQFQVKAETDAPTPSDPFVSITLVLVDASSNQDIGELMTGDEINLRDIETNSLNVRADTSDPVAAVAFTWDNAPITTEYNAPYALGGDRNSDYNKFAPLTEDFGQHSLLAQALDSNDAVIGEILVVLDIVDGSIAVPTDIPTIFTSMPFIVSPNSPTASPSLTISDKPSDVPTASPNLPTSEPSAFGGDGGYMVPTSSPVLNDDYMVIDAGATDQSLFEASQKRKYATEESLITNETPFPTSVFATHRFADWITYTIPVGSANSTVSIVLGFCEIYAPNCENKDNRRMNIVVQGEPYLTNFNVLDFVSCQTAMVVQDEFKTDENGSLEIALSAVSDKAFVSLIAIQEK